jgi:FhaA, N-terminal domain/FHA domain
MNPLKSVETTIANLVEGAFGRMFRAEVRPQELARKLAREMDAHRTVSLSRVYAPNEYDVWLSPRDRARYEGVEQEVIDELCAYLLEHARREELVLRSQPLIAFHTDERLSLGEFGIKAQLVSPEEAQAHRRASSAGVEQVRGRQPAEGAESPPPSEEHGNTMIYSSSARLRGTVEDAHGRREPARALLVLDDRRLLLPPEGGTIGRSRDCDVVFDDAGISRLHAQIRPHRDGWTVEDLGSTNGVLVNGRRVHGGLLLRPGDRIELGSTELVFDLR